MIRKIKKNGKFILIYASILFCLSILFSNFFSEKMAMSYNRFFLENQRATIAITYPSKEEIGVSSIPDLLNGISGLDYYYDFGTQSSNIGTLGININQDWKKLPLYQGKWERITEKNKVIVGKDAYIQLKYPRTIRLFGETYEVVGVLDNLSGSDYFSDSILFDLETFKEKTYPQSLASIVLFGSPSSVTKGIKSLSKEPIFTYDETEEFPSMEEYIEIMTGESKKIIIEFGLLIILTLIIISGNYLKAMKKEISIRKWVGNSYSKTIVSFIATYLFSLITGGLIAFFIHSFSYSILKIDLLQRPYVEVWSLFILIGTIIFIFQTAHISFVYLFTTALDFLKGAEE